MSNRAAKQNADEERRRREEEKRAFKEAQELEALRRCFKRIDKSNDGSIDVNELMQEVCAQSHECVPQQRLVHLLCPARRTRALPSRCPMRACACYF